MKKYLILMMAFLATMFFFGCDNGGSSSNGNDARISTDSVINEKLITDFTGPNSVTVAGTWTNEFYLSTGDVTVDISFDSTTQEITIIWDIDGNVYGGADPGFETFVVDMSEFVTNGTATLTATSSTYGDISASLTFYTDSTGEFTGTAENEPTGQVTNQSFDGRFEVESGVVTFYIDSATFEFLGNTITCTNVVTATIN